MEPVPAALELQNLNVPLRRHPVPPHRQPPREPRRARLWRLVFSLSIRRVDRFVARGAVPPSALVSLGGVVARGTVPPSALASLGGVVAPGRSGFTGLRGAPFSLHHGVARRLVVGLWAEWADTYGAANKAAGISADFAPEISPTHGNEISIDIFLTNPHSGEFHVMHA